MHIVRLVKSEVKSDLTENNTCFALLVMHEVYDVNGYQDRLLRTCSRPARFDAKIEKMGKSTLVQRSGLFPPSHKFSKG